MKRLALVALLATVVSSSSGCAPLYQFTRWVLYGDPYDQSGPPLCPFARYGACGGPGCSYGGHGACGPSGCGPRYWGDFPDTTCQPCDHCGNYIGPDPSYSYSGPGNYEGWGRTGPSGSRYLERTQPRREGSRRSGDELNRPQLDDSPGEEMPTPMGSSTRRPSRHRRRHRY